MNFTEAIKELKDGKKVRRGAWEKTLYIKIVEIENEGQKKEVAQAFALSVNPFTWDVSILTSFDWKIDDSDDLHKFEDVIAALQNGKTAKLSNWKDEYIILDKQTNEIIFCFYAPRYFSPTFDCLRALDWHVID